MPQMQKGSTVFPILNIKIIEKAARAQPLGGGGGRGVRTPQLLLGPLQLFGQIFSWGSNLGGVRCL
jgi:hypothetical protein